MHRDATPDTPVTKVAESAAAEIGQGVARPFVLRLAKYVRHLELASSITSRLDSFMSAALMVKRPRWVDACVLGLRGVSAVGDTIDARIHREVNKHGVHIWPCYNLMLIAVHTHYAGTYFKDMHWFKIPRANGKRVDVVLSAASGSTSGSMMYVDGDATVQAEVMSQMWSSWAPVCEIRGSGDHDLGASAGDPLLVGHARNDAAAIAAEFASGERGAVLLLGKPGVGKSYIAEQVAATIAAQRSADARPARVMRLNAFNRLGLEPLVGILDTLQPDVIVVHDVDTDAPTAAILLRFTEACVRKGVALVCTANAADKMHEAALRDGRLGAPIRITAAQESLVRAILGEHASEASAHAAWPQVREWPLSAVDKLRRALAAGKPIDVALQSTASTLTEVV